MSYSQVLQRPKKNKNSKVVFNLTDLKTAATLFHEIPEDILTHTFDEKESLFLVNFVQKKIAKHNYFFSGQPRIYLPLFKTR